MSWYLGRMKAFDTETTGTDPETVRIVTAATISSTIGNSDIRSRSWMVNPGVEIPEEAAEIHGVSTEKAVAEGMSPDRACLEIEAELINAWGRDAAVVAYNATYDLTVLDRELRRHCGRGLQEVGPVIDPYVLDRAVDRYRSGKRTLTAVCQVYGVELDDAHTATADAEAAELIARAIGIGYSEVGGLSLAELQEYQQKKHFEWAENFGAYLARQGKPDDVCREWPIRAVAQEVG